jgi:hypothetical protein
MRWRGFAESDWKVVTHHDSPAAECREERYTRAAASADKQVAPEGECEVGRHPVDKVAYERSAYKRRNA